MNKCLFLRPKHVQQFSDFRMAYCFLAFLRKSKTATNFLPEKYAIQRKKKHKLYLSLRELHSNFFYNFYGILQIWRRLLVDVFIFNRGSFWRVSLKIKLQLGNRTNFVVYFIIVPPMWISFSTNHKPRKLKPKKLLHIPQLICQERFGVFFIWNSYSLKKHSHRSLPFFRSFATKSFIILLPLNLIYWGKVHQSLKLP